MVLTMWKLSFTDNVLSWKFREINFLNIVRIILVHIDLTKKELRGSDFFFFPQCVMICSQNLRESNISVFTTKLQQ